jgi:hypothetical protein
MNKKEIYEQIMSDISKILKRQLKEDIFTNGSYDRWRLSAPEYSKYDQECKITVDVLDILNGDVIDDRELSALENVCKKSGITDETIVNVYTDGSEILDDTELTNLLSNIKIETYKNKISTYVYDYINRCLEAGDYTCDAIEQADYETGRRDDYL